MLSLVITSVSLIQASQAFLTQQDCVEFRAEARRKFRAQFYGCSPCAWAPATRTLFNHFISWSCPEFLSSTWATVLCLSQPWSINNKLNGCMQAGGPRLWNVKGLYHYGWQLLICSPAGQSLQITGTQFHAIICVRHARCRSGRRNKGLRGNGNEGKAVVFCWGWMLLKWRRRGLVCLWV